MVAESRRIILPRINSHMGFPIPVVSSALLDTCTYKQCYIGSIGFVYICVYIYVCIHVTIATIRKNECELWMGWK